MVYRQEGSRRWYVTVVGRDGKPVHLATGTRDHATAKAMAAMLLVLGGAGTRQWDLIDAVTARPRRLKLAVLYDHYVRETLGELRTQLDDLDLAPEVEQWRATIAQRHRGESIRKYRKWSEALFPLGDGGAVKPALRSVVADPVHIGDVLEQLGGSNTNRRRHHEVFVDLFAYLAEKRVVPAGVMAAVGKAKRDKKEQPHIARLADVLRLVHAMADAQLRAIAALAEGGGLELSAIQAMRGIDIVNRAERIVFAHGSKNVYRDRKAVIQEEFWPAVVGWVDEAKVHPLGLLFDVADWRIRQVWREVTAQLRAKHVPIPSGYSPHKARHTYVIRRLEAGDDIQLITENLGHSDAATLLRDYAKYRPKATEIRRVARAEEGSR